MSGVIIHENVTLNGAIIFPIFMVACQKEIPEPETKDISFHSYEAILASAKELRKVDPFFISHQVKGNDVYVECRIKGYFIPK